MEELIRRAQGGEEAACAQLVEENSALVWSIARRFFGRGAFSAAAWTLRTSISSVAWVSSRR